MPPCCDLSQNVETLGPIVEGGVFTVTHTNWEVGPRANQLGCKASLSAALSWGVGSWAPQVGLGLSWLEA